MTFNHLLARRICNQCYNAGTSTAAAAAGIRSAISPTPALALAPSTSTPTRSHFNYFVRERSSLEEKSGSVGSSAGPAYMPARSAVGFGQVQKHLRVGGKALHTTRWQSTSAAEPLASNEVNVADEIAERLAVAKDTVDTIAANMDQHVLGHDQVKRGVLLALLAREHVYIEGPPGVGKTMLAEVAADATDLEFFFYQLHRDTRLQELVGDAVIHRETSPNGGEVIRQSNRPGGILTSEICVLDDISRAPGEALNVLLRILNERKYGNDPIPLVTAIATGNPAGDEYYTEPLDPANVDRFVIQIRTLGLIQQQNWAEAARVIGLYAERLGQDAQPESHKVTRESFDTACAAVTQVVVTEQVKGMLLQVLQLLAQQYGLDEKNSLLTDRTFLVKALKVIKANAVLEGRAETAPADLLSLQFVTTFRIPESVHNQMPRIISKIIATATTAANKAAKAAAAAAAEPLVNAAAAKFAEAEALKGAKDTAAAHANKSTSTTAASAWKDPDVLPSWRAGLQEDMDDFSSFLKKETGGGALDTGSDDETPKDPKDPNRWW